MVTPMTARFLVSMLPKPEMRQYNTLAQAVGKLAWDLPNFELFVHLRSLTMFEDQDCPYFVGVNYTMPNRELTKLKPLNL